MRIFLLLCALVTAGCAVKPGKPPQLATAYFSTTGQPLQAAPTRADETLDPQALAEARKAAYKLVNTNGQVLYCTSDAKLGTHIQRNTDTVCLTAQEIIARHEQTRQSLDRFVPWHLCTPAC